MKLRCPQIRHQRYVILSAAGLLLFFSVQIIMTRIITNKFRTNHFCAGAGNRELYWRLR